MTDRIIGKRQSATLIIAVMVLAGSLIAGMAVAAPTITDSANGTTFDSEVQSGTTIEDFNASAGQNYTVSLNVTNGHEAAYRIELNSTGDRYYKNSSMENVTTTDGGNYTIWNGTFTEADLDRVPMTVNQNVTMDLVAYNKSNTSDSTTVQFYINNTGERSVHRVDSGTLDSKDHLSESEEDPLNPFGETITHVEVEDHEVNVNGSNTTVIYTLEDSNATDPFDNATEVVDTDGAMTFMVVTMEAGGDTHRLPVFLNEKNEDWSLSDDGSYAVYDSDADTFTFELGEEADGEGNVTIDATTDRYGITDIITVWQEFGRSAAMEFAGQGLSGLNPLTVVPSVGSLSIGINAVAG